MAASELVRRTLASSGSGQKRTTSQVTTSVTERARRGRDAKDGVKRIITTTEVITGELCARVGSTGEVGSETQKREDEMNRDLGDQRWI